MSADDEFAADIETMRFVRSGVPGRLDERRVYVEYADGCVTAFAQDSKVSVQAALDSHRNIHRPGDTPTTVVA